MQHCMFHPVCTCFLLSGSLLPLLCAKACFWLVCFWHLLPWAICYPINCKKSSVLQWSRSTVFGWHGYIQYFSAHRTQDNSTQDGWRRLGVRFSGGLRWCQQLPELAESIDLLTCFGFEDRALGCHSCLQLNTNRTSIDVLFHWSVEQKGYAPEVEMLIGSKR